MEVIASPQTSAPVKLHTVTSQIWDLNILGQQESRTEYIPVCRIVMLCCWACSSQHFEGLQSLSSGSGRPRTIVAPCYYNILAGQGDQWSYSKFPCGHISPLCTVHYPDALNEVSFSEGINVKVVAVCLLHTKLIWHQRYSQLWHCVVWQICTDISNYLLSPSSGWWRQQVPLRWRYISTGLQWLDQGDKQHHYHHLENLRYHFIWHSTSPWNFGQNLIWGCKFRYLFYVWVVWLSECLWTSQKVLLSACGWDLSFSLPWIGFGVDDTWHSTRGFGSTGQT